MFCVCRIYKKIQKISATSLKTEIEFSFYSEQRTVKLHKAIQKEKKQNEMRYKGNGKKALKTLMLFTVEKKMEVLESLKAVNAHFILLKFNSTILLFPFL